MRRKKKSNLKLILFVLLVSISLGYAFLQTDLTINGASKVTAASWDIYFNNVQVTTGSVSLSTGDSIPTINPTDDTLVEYTVTLHNPGEFYEFTVDVVNAGTLDGMIDTISSKMNGTTLNTPPVYLKYEVTYDNDMPIKEKHLLPKNTTQTYKIRLEFRDDINPSDLPSTLQSNTFSFEVSYVQADDTAKTRSTLPIIKRVTSSIDETDFRSDTYREKIKTITLSEEISPPEDYVASWDVGQAQNGNVMAYVTVNEDDNTMYDLYIQGDGALYANPNSQYLFYDLTGVDAINNIEVLNTSKVTNMNRMFSSVGYNSTIFTLNLGSNFDTSKVTEMESMFFCTGRSSTVFTLDLGPKFDTSNVEKMYRMFACAGYKSTVFTLNLGDKFDTSNVIDMDQMFYETGYYSTVFTLNLGNKFNTTKVTNMHMMFYGIGYNKPVFTLDLGSKFDTSNVINMSDMFANTAYNSTVFTLNLGNKFDTSKTTNMQEMFLKTAYANANLELDLSTFDFSSVTNYNNVFYNVKATTKIWVKDAAAQAWVIARHANLTTANVLIKGA